MPRKKKITAKQIAQKICALDGYNLTKKMLQDLGVDLDDLPLDFKNFYVKKTFLRGIQFGVKDNDKDLDGKPIRSNQNLYNKVLKHWYSNKKSILYTEVADLNIYTYAGKIEIGKNILLDDNSKDRYIIKRINEDQDLEGRWENKAVTMQNVVDSLRDYDYNTTRQRMGEVTLNKDLVKFLKDYFVFVEKPTRGELIDIGIGKGKKRVVIELKLAKQIKNLKESREARSQIEDYCEEFSNKKMMLLVAGKKAEKKLKYVQDVLNKAKKLGIKAIYLNPEN